jgi:hypothetical protein
VLVPAAIEEVFAMLERLDDLADVTTLVRALTSPANAAR